MEGEQRTTARLITGWANVIFLFIVLSGMYLWLPRVWTAAQVRAVALFRGGLRGKARDFNWHNVIGIWSAVPLAIVVATAMPISFPWANALVYRVMGEDPPAQGQGGAGGRREQAEVDPLTTFNTLDARWAQAEGQVAGWKSINLRVPASSSDPLVFLIDEGNGGQPQLRSTLTLEAATGSVVTWEPFEALTPGRQLRSWSRFTHTGEAFGLTGQTIAGLVSGGGAVLVWTGIALAFRRFLGWRSRQRRPVVSPAEPDLAGARSSFISASMARHDAPKASSSDRPLTQPGVFR